MCQHLSANSAYFRDIMWHVAFIPVVAVSQEWIMEQWEKNFYISAVAGANNGNALVVMSKGMFCAVENTCVISQHDCYVILSST